MSLLKSDKMQDTDQAIDEIIAEKDEEVIVEKEQVVEEKTVAYDPDKLKALDTAIDQIDKKYGKGSIMRMGEGRVVSGINVIPTDILSLDVALGIHGWPRGRIIEIFGPESSGKTTLSLHAIASTQARNGLVAFIDAEHALDPTYAKNLGVNTDDLLISQPDTGEQALEIAETLTRSGAVDTIVIDSVAALVPRAEIEGEMGDAQMGLQARLMSQAMRKLSGAVSKTNVCMIFINQVREKIGVYFGNPETTTGGRALKFYASIRIDIRRTGSIKDGQNVIGNQTKIKVVKNKLAPPFREANVTIIYGKGIDKYRDLIDVALNNKVIAKSGAWYNFGEERLGQGTAKVAELLENDTDLFNKIKELTVTKM